MIYVDLVRRFLGDDHDTEAVACVERGRGRAN